MSFLTSLSAGNSATEPDLYGAEFAGFLPAYPVCMPHDRWGDRGGGGGEVREYMRCENIGLNPFLHRKKIDKNVIIKEARQTLAGDSC